MHGKFQTCDVCTNLLLKSFMDIQSSEQRASLNDLSLTCLILYQIHANLQSSLQREK